MKLESIVLAVVRAAYLVAIRLSSWVGERRMRRRRVDTGEYLDLKTTGAKEAPKRRPLPPVVFAAHERQKPGGGRPRS